MAKFTLPRFTSSFSITAKLNAVVEALENLMQNRILYRDNISGEPNQMKTLLDMDNNPIINLPDAVNPRDAVNLKQLHSAVNEGLAFDTPAQAALASLPVGAKFSTKGANAVGDGGHGDFIVEAAFSIPDGYSRVLLANGNHAVMLPSESCNVKSFGADHTGIADSVPAIKRAATYANNHKIKMVFGSGEYYLNSPANIGLSVSIDASGATFILGDGLGTSSVFNIIGSDLFDITDEIALSEITKGSTTISSAEQYENGIIRIDSDVPNVKRYTSDSQHLFKTEVGYITKGGVLVTPIRHDYSDGSITSVKYRPDDRDRLTLRGGTIDLNGKNSPRFIRIDRSNVTTENWSVFDSTQSENINGALLFRAFNSAGLVFSDFDGDAMRQKTSAAYSYLFEIGHCFNTIFKRCDVQGGWGGWAANSCNGYSVYESNFDRFDAHYNTHDITVDNCTFYQSVQYGCGGGVLRVTNSTKIVKLLTPNQSNVTYNPSIVSARSDYGGFWDGTVLIDNVNIVVGGGLSFTVANRLRAFYSGASGDFGAGRSLPDPSIISVKNVFIDAPADVLSQTSFGFNAVVLTGGIYNGSSGGRVPPRRILVDGIYLTAQAASSRVRHSLVEQSYINSIAAGYAAPSEYFSIAANGIGNGSQSVDMQATALSGRGATGSLSVVSGGDNNLANGDRSWVPGGSSATTRGRIGSYAYGNNPSDNLGRYQSSGVVLQAQTTNSTSTRLVAGLLTNAPSVDNQFSTANNSVTAFNGMVVARSGSGNIGKGWRVSGLLRNSAGSVSIVGAILTEVIASGSGSESWDITVSVDGPNRSLSISVVGDPSLTVYWCARIDAVEQA